MRRLLLFLTLLLVPALAFGATFWTLPNEMRGDATIRASDGTSTDIIAKSYGTGVSSQLYLQSARGTNALPTQILSGDVVGQILIQGRDNAGVFRSQAGLLVTATSDITSAGQSDVALSVYGATGIAQYWRQNQTQLMVPILGTSSIWSGIAQFQDDVQLTVGGKRLYIPRASDSAQTISLYSPAGNTVRLSAAGSGTGVIEFEPTSGSGVDLSLDGTNVNVYANILGTSGTWSGPHTFATSGLQTVVVESTSTGGTAQIRLQSKTTDGGRTQINWYTRQTGTYWVGGVDTDGVWKLATNVSGDFASGVVLQSSSSSATFNVPVTVNAASMTLTNSFGNAYYYANGQTSGISGIQFQENSSLRWLIAGLYSSSDELVFNNNANATMMQLSQTGVLTAGPAGSALVAPHTFQGQGNSSTIANFINGGNSTPFGIFVSFSGASPNDKLRYFFSAQDNSQQKAAIWSDGSGQFDGGIAAGDNPGSSDQQNPYHKVRKLSGRYTAGTSSFINITHGISGAPASIKAVNCSVEVGDDGTWYSLNTGGWYDSVDAAFRQSYIYWNGSFIVINKRLSADITITDNWNTTDYVCYVWHEAS